MEWLKGETEEYETDITDKRELFIRDVMTSILSKLSFDMEQAESDFTKDLLLLMLMEYELFVDSFQFAYRNFKDNAENAALARTAESISSVPIAQRNAVAFVKGERIMAKGSVRKKGKKWYYRFYVEDSLPKPGSLGQNDPKRLAASPPLSHRFLIVPSFFQPGRMIDITICH